jgi:hypothetical protein
LTRPGAKYRMRKGSLLSQKLLHIPRVINTQPGKTCEQAYTLPHAAQSTLHSRYCQASNLLSCRLAHQG